MTECFWPEKQVCPWHAIFVSQEQDSWAAYRAATDYGQSLVNLGLAENYVLVNTTCGSTTEFHAIPRNSGGPSTNEYISQIFDNY